MKFWKKKTIPNLVFFVIHNPEVRHSRPVAMQTERGLYPWLDLGKIPESKGIYAWYYKHFLSESDILSLIKKLNKQDINGECKEIIVQTFLKSHLFDFFQEDPYQVTMKGPLKPTYNGHVPHVVAITSDLVKRIAFDPTRLWILKSVLENAIPDFSAPIYIGMSVNLKTRIGRHKALIQNYKNSQLNEVSNDFLTDEEEESDKSFAREVIRRGFLTHRLFVSIRTIENSLNGHVDAENILNRINFPLCGRN